MKGTGHFREERYSYAVGVAAGLFLERGIDAVKMTDIAENSGIGVASLYRYFETKTEIVIRAGIILWNRVQADFLNYIQLNKASSGLTRLIYDLGYFRTMFEKQKSFIKFLDDFDRIMLSEKVPKENLVEYEKSIVNFYGPISEACEKGWEDGTIRKDVDLPAVYAAVTHSLVAVCQKYIRGEILPSDDASKAGKEIETLLEMTAAYLAA